MKILLLFILFTSFNCFAKAKKMMVCLGKEEQYIHKNKIGGAFLKLNQDMIGSLVQFPSSVKMTPKMYNKICNPEIKFHSLQLLKYLIENNDDVFYIDTNKEDISQTAISKVAIKELQQKSIHIFIDFLNALQADAPSPNCIMNAIEELKVIYTDLRYLQEELGTQKIIDSINNKQKIFQELERAPSIIQSCHKAGKTATKRLKH
jgi:hypothetical protein